MQVQFTGHSPCRNFLLFGFGFFCFFAFSSLPAAATSDVTSSMFCVSTADIIIYLFCKIVKLTCGNKAMAMKGKHEVNNVMRATHDTYENLFDSL